MRFGLTGMGARGAGLAVSWVQMLTDGRFRGTERAAVVEAFSRRSRTHLMDRMLTAVAHRAGCVAQAERWMVRRFVLASAWFEYHKHKKPNPIYIFKHDGSDWTLEQSITATVQDVEFAASFAIDGSTLVVGAPGFDSRAPRDPLNNRGRVNTYNFTDGHWSTGPKLTADDSQTGDRFGSAVALEGSILAAGAPSDDTTGADAGSVYIFQQEAGTWSIRAKITPPDLYWVRLFGKNLVLHKNVLFVAAETLDNLGTIYEFHCSGGFWKCIRRFGPDGTDVRFIGGTLVVFNDWVVTTGNRKTGQPGGKQEVLLFPRG